MQDKLNSDNLDNVSVGVLTEEYSDFHYCFFYSQIFDLSFYSGYCLKSGEGYKRIFEVTKGKLGFDRALEIYNKHPEWFKWYVAHIPFTEHEAKSLKDFLGNEKRKAISVYTKNFTKDLDFLVDLDRKIMGAKV